MAYLELFRTLHKLMQKKHLEHYLVDGDYYVVVVMSEE